LAGKLLQRDGWPIGAKVTTRRRQARTLPASLAAIFAAEGTPPVCGRGFAGYPYQFGW
jgi:hypothetical protein